MFGKKRSQSKPHPDFFKQPGTGVFALTFIGPVTTTGPCELGYNVKKLRPNPLYRYIRA